MEGHFEGHPDGGAPLILFGIPNAETETVDYKVEIPYLSSLILTHDLTSPVPGLKDFPAEERPPVGIVFWSFRVMVGLGFAMLGLGAWALVLRLRRRMYDQPWLHRSAVAMGPAGFIAVLAGWITTEVGRQPWTVYGLMSTNDSIAPVEASAVASSLVAFIVVYFLLFGAGTVYILRLMGKRPNGGKPIKDLGPTRTAGVTPAPAVDDKFFPAE